MKKAKHQKTNQQIPQRNKREKEREREIKRKSETFLPQKMVGLKRGKQKERAKRLSGGELGSSTWAGRGILIKVDLTWN